MTKTTAGRDASDLRFGIVVSRFNDNVTERLLTGALGTLKRYGVSDDNVTVLRVPGSFEIPHAARRLCLGGTVDAVICLGALIRGETDHYEYLAAAVTTALAQLSASQDTPVTFGVLTVSALEQAMDRAGLKHGNKGSEAALAALEMANLSQRLKLGA